MLGQAYTDGNARLTDADIDRCFTGKMDVPDVERNNPTWIGIDMGLMCHAVVGQGNDITNMHIIEFAEVPIKELNEFVMTRAHRYNLVGGACDRFPYTPSADDLFGITDGKIVPVEYRGQKPINFVKDQVTEEITHAQMNRTQLIDEVARGVRRGWLRFSGYGNQKPIISEHLKDMVRDEQPEKEAKWVKLTGSDHYFHALAFLYGAVKLKETQRSLFSDPRSTVGIVGVNTPMSSNNLFGKPNRSQGGLI